MDRKRGPTCLFDAKVGAAREKDSWRLCSKLEEKKTTRQLDRVGLRSYRVLPSFAQRQRDLETETGSAAAAAAPNHAALPSFFCCCRCCWFDWYRVSGASDVEEAVHLCETKRQPAEMSRVADYRSRRGA